MRFFEDSGIPPESVVMDTKLAEFFSIISLEIQTRYVYINLYVCKHKAKKKMPFAASQLLKYVKLSTTNLEITNKKTQTTTHKKPPNPSGSPQSPLAPNLSAQRICS